QHATTSTVSLSALYPPICILLMPPVPIMATLVFSMSFFLSVGFYFCRQAQMTRFRKKERFIMIFTLTPNPSVDIFAESAHSRARHARIGGKGVNVSRFLARLGRESVCLFTAGERLGRFIAGSL